MALTLYGTRGSRTARVMWLLAEMELPHAFVEVGFSDSAQSAEHLARNPNGRIPVLDDDDFVLFESMAINLHLARTRGGPLAPANAHEDALAMQWSFWIMSECEPWMERIMATGPGKSREQDSALRSRAEERLVRPLDAMESQLSAAHLLGERFTVVDVNVASVFAWAREGQLDFSPWPRITSWMARCFERPKRVLDAEPEGWR